MAAAREPGRYRFFAGKGGVGKTTLAAASAFARAREGAKVLLLSTDPAHSLSDAVEARLSAKPKRLAPNLHAAELDADAALDRWLGERRAVLHAIAARGTYLDDDDIDRLLKLSLPGVDELIGLLELQRLAREGDYEEVVVDTAPTGHTLRLLAMPETLRNLAQVFDDMQAKHRFLAESLGGRYRSDAADALIEEIDREGQALQALLRDPERVAFTWVALPEELPLAQAGEGMAALDALGVRVEALWVNRLTPRPEKRCALCDGRRAEEKRLLADVVQRFPGRAIFCVEAQEREPRGGKALLALARAVEPLAKLAAPRPSRPAVARRAKLDLAALAPEGTRLLLFGGKGGVGKTSCATAAAIALAEHHKKGRVLLLSTDPAHSLHNALAADVGDVARPVKGAPKNLLVRELDAAHALDEKRARYRQSIDDLFDALRGGSHLDASFDRQVVQDLVDLAPPGLDELFGVVAVIDALFSSDPAVRFDAVVLDTAPTGHTLRLLELPGHALEWVQALLAILLKYREVVSLGQLAQDLVQLSKELKQLSALLADPSRTRFIAVTRPAELPRAETARLVKALDRLHVPVGAVLVNACTPDGCSRCTRQAKREAKLLKPGSFGRRDLAMIRAPALALPPRGPASLRSFASTWSFA